MQNKFQTVVQNLDYLNQWVLRENYNAKHEIQKNLEHSFKFVSELAATFSL